MKNIIENIWMLNGGVGEYEGLLWEAVRKRRNGATVSQLSVKIKFPKVTAPLQSFSRQ